MTIIEAMHDDRFFYRTMKGSRAEWTWGAWEVFLKGLFALPMVSSEIKLFHDCTQLEQPPAERARESFVICGRRSGKSFISAIIAVYLATFRDWRAVLSPGERGYIFILAVDKLQARVVRDYVRAILNSVPSFRKLIESETVEEIRLTNGVSLAVKTSSFRSVRGYTLLACILEEIGFWRSEDSANPDVEVLKAVRPALATVEDSILLAISTPYARSGALWEAYKDHFGRLDGPLVWRAPSLTMNPTLDPARIEAELAADPEAASEWYAVFRTDISAFIPVDLVESVIVPGRYELLPAAAVHYYAFADPSGGRQDSFTLAISHRDSLSGRIVLDVLHERRPPFNPEAVAEEYAGVVKNYGVGEISGDRFAGSWVSGAFEKYGVLYKPSEKTASELYLESLALLASGSVELLDHKRLKGQLANLERRTRPGGRDLITHGPGLHDDCANAAAGVLVLAAQEAGGREGRVMSISGRSVSSSSSSSEPEESGGGRVFTSGAGRSGRDIDLEESFRRAIMHDNVDKAKSERDKRPPEDRD
jgi:hypothetical protein